MASGGGGAGLLDELLAALESEDEALAAPASFDEAPEAPAEGEPARLSRRSAPGRRLADDLGEQLISEILEGVKAGRQGIMVTTPDRLRTAIFVRGSTLQEFALLAGITPSTLSRALGGETVAPSTWRRIITTLSGLG